MASFFSKSAIRNSSKIPMLQTALIYSLNRRLNLSKALMEGLAVDSVAG